MSNERYNQKARQTSQRHSQPACREGRRAAFWIKEDSSCRGVNLLLETGKVVEKAMGEQAAFLCLHRGMTVPVCPFVLGQGSTFVGNSIFRPLGGIYTGLDLALQV